MVGQKMGYIFVLALPAGTLAQYRVNQILFVIFVGLEDIFSVKIAAIYTKKLSIGFF